MSTLGLSNVRLLAVLETPRPAALVELLSHHHTGLFVLLLVLVGEDGSSENNQAREVHYQKSSV